MTRISKSLRIPAEALAEIDRQAKAHGLTRTDYMIRASTGELHNTTAEATARIEALEAAVRRLEQFAMGDT